MKEIYILLLSTLIFLGCTSTLPKNNSNNPIMLNEHANDHTNILKGYQPIDPISYGSKKTTPGDNFNLIFPNEASRIVVGQMSSSGAISYGTFNIARAGKSYSVVIDYIKYTNRSIPGYYLQYASGRSDYVNDDSTSYVVEMLEGFSIIGDSTQKGKTTEITKRSKIPTSKYLATVDTKNEHQINIPVYIGVGLRIQANITVLKDSIDIGSLFGLGIAASENKIAGSLIIQSLGISGEAVTSAIPIPDKINESTVQAAIQSLGIIKSKLYDDSIILVPQIVAFSLPVGLDGSKDYIESKIQNKAILSMITTGL